MSCFIPEVRGQDAVQTGEELYNMLKEAVKALAEQFELDEARNARRG